MIPEPKTSTWGGEDYAALYGAIKYDGLTVLDIGADWGSTAYFFLSRGARRVVASEIDKDLMVLLVANCDGDKRVNILPGLDSASTLARWIKDFKPDVIKMDIEGGEKISFLPLSDKATQTPDVWILETHDPATTDAARRRLLDSGFAIISETVICGVAMLFVAQKEG